MISNTSLQSFNFEGNAVRTVTVDGEVWFVARDVATALGYSDTINAIKAHCRGVANHHPIVDSLGRTQEARIISEPDVMRLIVSSRLPAAQEFERLVFEQILPEVRRTGSYQPVKQFELPQDYLSALKELVSVVEQKNELEAKVEADAPKVLYVDTFVKRSHVRKLREVAKDLGVQETKLRELLLAKKWIYQESEQRWSVQDQTYRARNRYSASADKARYFHHEAAHDAPPFRGEVYHTLKVTPQGAEAIARLVKSEVAA